MATLGHACRHGAKQAEKVRPKRPRGRGGELPCSSALRSLPTPCPTPAQGGGWWVGSRFPGNLGSWMLADSRTRHHPLCASLLHWSLEEEVCLPQEHGLMLGKESGGPEMERRKICPSGDKTCPCDTSQSRCGPGLMSDVPDKAVPQAPTEPTSFQRALGPGPGAEPAAGVVPGGLGGLLLG